MISFDLGPVRQPQQMGAYQAQPAPMPMQAAPVQQQQAQTSPLGSPLADFSKWFGISSAPFDLQKRGYRFGPPNMNASAFAAGFNGTGNGANGMPQVGVAPTTAGAAPQLPIAPSSTNGAVFTGDSSDAGMRGVGAYAWGRRGGMRPTPEGYVPGMWDGGATGWARPSLMGAPIGGPQIGAAPGVNMPIPMMQ
jgi:hypothetical protein